MKNKISNIETLSSKSILRSNATAKDGQILMTQIINSKQFGTLENWDLDIVSDFEFRIYKIGGLYG